MTFLIDPSEGRSSDSPERALWLNKIYLHLSDLTFGAFDGRKGSIRIPAKIKHGYRPSRSRLNDARTAKKFFVYGEFDDICDMINVDADEIFGIAVAWVRAIEERAGDPYDKIIGAQPVKARPKRKLRFELLVVDNKKRMEDLVQRLRDEQK